MIYLHHKHITFVPDFQPITRKELKNIAQRLDGRVGWFDAGLQLAEKLGVTNRYVSMVLNGHRDPQGAEARFREAVMEIIQEKGV